MKFKKKTMQELKGIMVKDYGVSLNEEKLSELGTVLLRLTRLATAAYAQTDKKKIAKH